MYNNDLSIAAYKIEHKGASRRGDVKQQIPEDCWFKIQTTDYYSAKFSPIGNGKMSLLL